MDFLWQLFDTEGFPPRWHCGTWTDAHGWLHVCSDVAIFGAYTTIPCVLAYFTLRRRDVPFQRVFWLFVAFILFCGTGHLIEAIIFWKPVYRLAGLVKLGTAAVSWATVFALVPVIQQALVLRSPAELEREVAAATAELRRQRDAAAALAAIVESSADSIVSLDLEGRVRSWNPAAERLSGRSAEEMRGQPLLPVVGADQAEALARRIELAGAGERSSLDATHLHPDGREIPMSLTLSPILSDDGDVIGISIIGRDNTERHRYEEALRRSNEELERFAYVTSHDLKEPLRMVASYVELLGRRYEGQLDARADTYIHYAVDGARRMQRMLDAVLEMSRIGAEPITTDSVELGAVVADVAELLGLREQGATLEVGELPTVVGHREQLTRVMQNLLGNALKFRGEDPPRIRVSSQRADREWRISVTDNGIGFDAAHATQVFEMFRRLTSREAHDGTGMGLAIVSKIIAAHGGRVWAESTPGEGATFTFTLPASPPRAPSAPPA